MKFSVSEWNQVIRALEARTEWIHENEGYAQEPDDDRDCERALEKALQFSIEAEVKRGGS